MAKQRINANELAVALNKARLYVKEVFGADYKYPKKGFIMCLKEFGISATDIWWANGFGDLFIEHKEGKQKSYQFREEPINKAAVENFLKKYHRARSKSRKTIDPTAKYIKYLVDQGYKVFKPIEKKVIEYEDCESLSKLYL